MKATVVGAGIAGLTAAWELSRAGIEVVVLESERRAGGMIVTERRDGFLVEGGPDGWLAAERDISDLAAQLGVANGVVRQSTRGSWLWTGSTLERLEEGRAAPLLGIQTQGADLSAGFLSFDEGMERIVAALLVQVGSTVRSPLGVTGLTADHGRWRLTVTGGMTVEADGIVLALPAFSAGRLLEQAGVTGARELGGGSVTYFPSVTASLAYEQTQVGRPLEGTGFVTAPGAAGAVRACTYASQKFPGRAPAGYVLLRAFLGPTDGDPGEAAHRELSAALQIRGAPLWSRLFFWTKGIPRYTAHHASHVAEVRRRLGALTPVAIAGAGYDGAGVSACVRSGREAGREIVRRLSAA